MVELLTGDPVIVDILESSHVKDPLPGRLFGLYNLHRHIVLSTGMYWDHGRNAKSCSASLSHGLVFFHE